MIENNYNKKIKDITHIQETITEITNSSQIDELVEEPCRAACLALYNKNICTLMSCGDRLYRYRL